MPQNGYGVFTKCPKKKSCGFNSLAHVSANLTLKNCGIGSEVYVNITLSLTVRGSLLFSAWVEIEELTTQARMEFLRVIRCHDFELLHAMICNKETVVDVELQEVGLPAHNHDIPTN